MEHHHPVEESIATHLNELVGRIGARPTGSRSNRGAGEYIQSVFARYGWEVITQSFECLDWQASAA